MPKPVKKASTSHRQNRSLKNVDQVHPANVDEPFVDRTSSRRDGDAELDEDDIAAGFGKYQEDFLGNTPNRDLSDEGAIDDYREAMDDHDFLDTNGLTTSEVNKATRSLVPGSCTSELRRDFAGIHLSILPPSATHARTHHRQNRSLHIKNVDQAHIYEDDSMGSQFASGILTPEGSAKDFKLQDNDESTDEDGKASPDPFDLLEDSCEGTSEEEADGVFDHDFVETNCFKLDATKKAARSLVPGLLQNHPRRDAAGIHFNFKTAEKLGEVERYENNKATRSLVLGSCTSELKRDFAGIHSSVLPQPANHVSIPHQQNRSLHIKNADQVHTYEEKDSMSKEEAEGVFDHDSVKTNCFNPEAAKKAARSLVPGLLQNHLRRDAAGIRVETNLKPPKNIGSLSVTRIIRQPGL